ncbi:arsenosugar biosynthesis radical SAM (seleno)protein ArsS [Campylobacter mucosalis]|uniref:arsenosugar biosynthesis radical SAM (seleno)protein ArsS n=1 Tax=Campylobacter mucosalis TaxID=202 RepID=UPI00146FCB0E
MDIEFDLAKTMQLNITKRCNMSCYHCHVGANPKRDEMMSRDTIDTALAVFKKFGFKTLDVTGGAPELNENLEYIFSSFRAFADEILIRTNLTILLETKYQKFIEIYKNFDITIMASVPFYERDFNDSMRGKGSFDKQILALKLLNQAGIKKINLIYNPNGAYLPPNQAELELKYKQELVKYGVSFDRLFCMANVPIGNFAKMLKKFDEYEEYISLLEQNYKVENLQNVMCKTLINVAYDGQIYDCDFNAALQMNSSLLTIQNVLNLSDLTHKIKVDKHCLACVSGDGYGCFGVRE